MNRTQKRDFGANENLEGENAFNPGLMHKLIVYWEAKDGETKKPSLNANSYFP